MRDVGRKTNGAVQKKRTDHLRDPPLEIQSVASRLERAAALRAQLDLELRGGREGRERLADDLVGRHAPLERLVLEVLVPDLANAGVVPADHVIADCRRGRHGEHGGGDGGNGTEGENATHEISPDGERDTEIGAAKWCGWQAGRRPFKD